MVQGTTAAAVLTAAALLTGCGAHTGITQETSVSTAARENLGVTQVAWELQPTGEQQLICAEVLLRGVSGTVDSYRYRHGGRASDWTLSAQWLTDTCRTLQAS